MATSGPDFEDWLNELIQYQLRVSAHMIVRDWESAIMETEVFLEASSELTGFNGVPPHVIQAQLFIIKATLKQLTAYHEMWMAEVASVPALTAAPGYQVPKFTSK